jgi:hypothetical protein
MTAGSSQKFLPFLKAKEKSKHMIEVVVFLADVLRSGFEAHYERVVSYESIEEHSISPKKQSAFNRHIK